jgi:hypothetical protein
VVVKTGVSFSQKFSNSIVKSRALREDVGATGETGGKSRFSAPFLRCFEIFFEKIWNILRHFD